MTKKCFSSPRRFHFFFGPLLVAKQQQKRKEKRDKEKKKKVKSEGQNLTNLSDQFRQRSPLLTFPHKFSARKIFTICIHIYAIVL